MVIYFGEEVRNALENYLETTRASATPLPDHENALFYRPKEKEWEFRQLRIW